MMQCSGVRLISSVQFSSVQFSSVQFSSAFFDFCRSKGGLKKESLVKNKHGKVVSKKMMAKGKANKWIKAVTAARKALGIKGFAVISTIYDLLF